MPKSGLKDCGGWWVGVESDFSVKPPELNKMVTVIGIKELDPPTQYMSRVF